MEQHECIQEQRLRDLETGQAETRVYVKMIKEDIHEIKTSIKELRPPPGAGGNSKEAEKAWQPIVIELIKLAGLCVVILGAIVGAVKMMGG